MNCPQPLSGINHKPYEKHKTSLSPINHKPYEKHKTKILFLFLLLFVIRYDYLFLLLFVIRCEYCLKDGHELQLLRDGVSDAARPRPHATNPHLLDPVVVHDGARKAGATGRARAQQGRRASGVPSSRGAVDSRGPRTPEGRQPSPEHPPSLQPTNSWPQPRALCPWALSSWQSPAVRPPPPLCHPPLRPPPLP